MGYSNNIFYWRFHFLYYLGVYLKNSALRAFRSLISIKFDNGYVANLGSADVRKVATGEYTIDRWIGPAVGGTALDATTSKVVKDITTETGSILAATKNRSNQSNKGVSFVVFSLVFVFAFHWLSLFAALSIHSFMTCCL